MDKLEERVGPGGRKLFEQFIRKVNILQAKQQLEAQAQVGVTVARVVLLDAGRVDFVIVLGRVGRRCRSVLQ